MVNIVLYLFDIAIMSGRVHGAADPPGGGGGRTRQLRAGEGAGAAECRARSLRRPQKPIHTTTRHRSTYYQ